MSDRHVLMVLSNAVDGKDDEFNSWYDNKHLPDVLSVPGFVAAQRYTANALQLTEDGPPAHRYLAIYEIEGDVATALAGLGAAVEAGMFLSPALDMDTVLPVLYSPNGPRQLSF